MKFSKRVTQLSAEGAYVMMERAQALEAQGREIIHMEIGQPDFQTYDHIRLKGAWAIAEGYTRYTPSGGIPRLREVIAQDAGLRRGLQIRPDQVVVGPGAKPGLFFPTLAVIEPGDEVIYPDPGFPTYAAMINVAGGIPVAVPLKEENNFSFDMEVFDQLVNDRTRLIILNTPANPTGGVIPLGDLQHIAQVAIQHDCWVMSDEIYARLVYDGLKVPSIATLPAMAERTIIVDGFSKTYAMTGWRLGFTIMPVELAGRVELLLNHSVGCTASFTQIAGIEAITASQERVEAVVAEYQLRRDRIVSGLNTIPGVHCQKPQGAFYAFPNITSFGMPARELAQQLLEQANVAVLPGTDFGQHGEGYLRLCFAISPKNIDRALERIAEFLGKVI